MRRRPLPSPAPWAVSGQGLEWRIHCTRAGRVDRHLGLVATASNESDAYLISAAPDAVAALADLVAFNEPDSLADQQTDFSLRLDHEAAWERARRALAKAWGRRS